MNITCTPAMHDTLRVIFSTKSIPYSTGVGPSCIVMIVDKKYKKQTLMALKEWESVIYETLNQIG